MQVVVQWPACFEISCAVTDGRGSPCWDGICRIAHSSRCSEHNYDASMLCCVPHSWRQYLRTATDSNSPMHYPFCSRPACILHGTVVCGLCALHTIHVAFARSCVLLLLVYWALSCSVRGAEEAAKKAKRRLKRKKEKATHKKAKAGDKSTAGTDQLFWAGGLRASCSCGYARVHISASEQLRPGLRKGCLYCAYCNSFCRVVRELS